MNTTAEAVNKYIKKLKGVGRVSKLNGIPNQLLIHYNNATVFQSYDSIIAIQYKEGNTILGRDYKYSKTTSKYLNMFLGLNSSKELQRNIESGLYVVDETLV